MGKSEGSSGKRLDFFLPGMITINKECGRYPAISITGEKCNLNCIHCQGSLLRPMIPANTPDELISVLKRLEKSGMEGALISGGCDREGRMPWKEFIPVLQKFNTSLFLSCHIGLNVDKEIAEGIKSSSISQALIDVVGDNNTLKEIYNLPDFSVMEKTLYNVFTYGPEIIPHIIIGIYKGKIKGEYEALKMLQPYKPNLVVLVILMPEIMQVSPPPIPEVIEIFREAKRMFPKIALGCARPRGKYRYKLEEALIKEGLITRLCLWSDKAIKTAEKEGYKIIYHSTCCSV